MTPTKDGIREMIADNLKRAYDSVVKEPLPPDIKELVKGLR
jgi:hypothetical protein